ncbi:MAG: sigma-54 dependent transcriptional regulator [Phenylobacterium sp.]
MILDAERAEDQAFHVLRQIRAVRPGLPVIVTSSEANLVTAVRAVESGAFDHIAKPYRVDDLLAVAARALSPPRPRDATRTQARARRDDLLPMIGRSEAMQRVYRATARLVATDLTVLIVGESGTGKALIARALHDMGLRRRRAFVPLSLAASDPQRVETDLFGSGTESPGKLVEADGGTLFLDTIGDLPHAVQTRLLGLIDGIDPVINPATGRAVDVRLVAATNRDLRTLVREGHFREDLYFRLSVAPLRVPPLRERPDDIPDLAHAFLVRAEREGLPAKSLDRWAVQRLMAHDWPGNVRELENLLRRICAIYPDEVITSSLVTQELADPWPVSATPQVGSGSLAQAVALTLSTYFADAASDRPAALYENIMRAVELPLLQAALQATRGNKVKAAEMLGINRNTLRKKMDELGLETWRDGSLRPVAAAADVAAAIDRRQIAA